EDRGQMQPPLTRAQIGDIAAQPRPGNRRREIPIPLLIEHMISYMGRVRLRVLDRRGLECPQPLGLQTMSAHDRPHRGLRHLHTVLVQQHRQRLPPGHTPRRLHLRLDRSNQLLMPCMPLRRACIPALQPAVERRTGDAENLAHHHDRVGGPLCLNELVEILYCRFAAKKALTFPRNSFSCFKRAFSATTAWWSAQDADSGAWPANFSGCWARYFLIQLPSVPAFTPTDSAT